MDTMLQLIHQQIAAMVEKLLLMVVKVVPEIQVEVLVRVIVEP